MSFGDVGASSGDAEKRKAQAVSALGRLRLTKLTRTVQEESQPNQNEEGEQPVPQDD